MSTSKANFYRVSHIVLDVIPEAFRDLFRAVWSRKYLNKPWDDTTASGQMFLQKERNQTVKDKVRDPYMVHGDSSQFDGTCLFSILLYSSQNFLQGYPTVKNIIHRLRKIRNESFAHLPGASVTDSDYQALLIDVRTIFAELGWPITPICEIEQRPLNASDLNTSELEQLKDRLIAEEKRNQNLETRLDSLEATVGSVVQKSNAAGDAVKNLAEKVQSLESDVASNTAQLNLAETERHEGQVKLDSVEQKLTFTTKAAETNAKEIVLLRKDMASSIQGIGSAETEIWEAMEANTEKIDSNTERLNLLERGKLIAWYCQHSFNFFTVEGLRISFVRLFAV